MAQQARPNWNSHKEYFRDQFRSQVTGFGHAELLDYSHRMNSLADGVHQAQDQDVDEDEHLDEAEGAETLEHDGPREDEHRLHVEDDEEKPVDVIANVGLIPARADRVDPALIGELLAVVGLVGRSTEATPSITITRMAPRAAKAPTVR